MLSSQVITDESGQVRIVEKDDRGEPDFWSLPNSADVRQWGSFQEAFSVPMAREPATGKGSFRTGTLFVSGQVLDGTAADYVCIEVQIMGYVGASATVIKRMAFGPGASDDLLRLDESSSFDRIAIFARQNVNGSPDSTTPCQVMSLQAAARFTR